MASLRTNGAHVPPSWEPQVQELYGVIEAGDTDAVASFVKQLGGLGASGWISINPLWAASAKGHVDIVIALLVHLGKRVDVDHVSVIDGTTALGMASLKGHTVVVMLLLKSGANVDQAAADGSTPLWNAAHEGFLVIAKLLLDHGANINLCRLCDGTSPLWGASSAGHFPVVLFLLSRKADVNIVSKDGTTALNAAVHIGNHNIVSMLLKHGANIDQATSSGATPLHVACSHGRFDIVKVLLAHRADIEQALLNGGETPLVVAARNDFYAIVIELLAHGASLSAAGRPRAWSPSLPVSQVLRKFPKIAILRKRWVMLCRMHAAGKVNVNLDLLVYIAGLMSSEWLHR